MHNVQGQLTRNTVLTLGELQIFFPSLGRDKAHHQRRLAAERNYSQVSKIYN